MTLRDLYDFAKTATNPDTDVSRHGPRKAALELLTTHATLFKAFFYQEYKVSFAFFLKFKCILLVN
jgi:hypothetical protein